MMLKRTKVTKKLVKQEQRVVGKSRKLLSCKECGDEIENISADIASITCWRCCAKMAAPPDFPSKPKSPEERRPRGWQFMKEYRAPDGTLYHRGVKVDEEIPTTVADRPKRSSVRTTTTSTKKSSDDSRHSKRADDKSTTRKSVTKRKSGVTGRSVAGVKTKRSNSVAKKSVKRKTRRPAV